MTAQLAIADENRGAELSACGLYRYRLWRAWRPGRRMLWVMLNPSTANGRVDDPTIRKCVGFTKRLGYPGLDVVNLFAWRATDPRELRTVEDPVGPDNDAAILTASDQAVAIAFAWGGFRWDAVRPRAEHVREMLFDQQTGIEIECLGYTDRRDPRHPLMLGYKTEFEEYQGP